MLARLSATPLVLDTNVVLDWLAFRDPSSLPVSEAIRSGRCRWHATAAMRLELERVLTYKNLSRVNFEPAMVLSNWDAWVATVDPATPLPNPVRCTDPDDQKFIDLGLQLGGCTLLSRDRAVLKLARRARPLGLTIAAPQSWAISLAGQRLEQMDGG
jgi:predicted nucleic acid-binding protein